MKFNLLHNGAVAGVERNCNCEVCFGVEAVAASRESAPAFFSKSREHVAFGCRKKYFQLAVFGCLVDLASSRSRPHLAASWASLQSAEVSVT